MSDNSNNDYNVLLTIQTILIILKMFNLIDWSWWMVCIPIYISLALIVFYCLLIAILYLKDKKGK